MAGEGARERYWRLCIKRFETLCVTLRLLEKLQAVLVPQKAEKICFKYWSEGEGVEASY